MTDDPWLRLAQARRDHLQALAVRDATCPGSPGYREAVHRVGVTWTTVRYWERMVEQARESG